MADVARLLLIRDARSDDAERLCAIYNYYVTQTTATFEEESVSIGEMRNRIAEITASWPWLVAEEEGRLVGYACAFAWKGRSAYRFSLEGSIYLDREHRGRGIGRRLYGDLIAVLRGRACHSLIGGIALPNDACIALHEKLGFVKVAQFKDVGYKFGRWIDVGYWQLVL
jgi:L-amino acid N-acyltransferase YncA